MTNNDEKYQANFEAALLAISLNRSEARTLEAQLVEALRQLILSDLAVPGLRVPPTRVLAGELSVSRSTALGAIEQLKAEGYLETRRGAGTFVAADLPHLSAPPSVSQPKRAETQPKSRQLRPFAQGPDVRRFPHRDWARHLDAAWARPTPALLAPADPMGWWPLRRAIADHLQAWRGITADPSEIVITSGAAESFALVFADLSPGATIATEAPAFAPLLAEIDRAGLSASVFPVDEDGFDPCHLNDQIAGVVVTPSRQFPLGMTLPVARRLALIDWAAKAGSLIVEDDYDSEFRYSGAPLPALASLDPQGCVFYAGSFSKLLTPSLRLGYLVVPPPFVARVSAQIAARGAQASLVPQPALARFMDSGGFATHLRRMRRIYAGRYRLILAQVQNAFAGLLDPVPQPSGMHLFCRLGARLSGWSDAQIAELACAQGLAISALSDYPEAIGVGEGLVLGFAAHDEAELAQAMDQLHDLLSACAGQVAASDDPARVAP